MNFGHHKQAIGTQRALGAFVLFFAFLAAGNRAMGQAEKSFRVGFSSALFTDINENDAKASIKAWGDTIAKERGIPTDPEARILSGFTSMSQALQDKTIDAVGLTAIEYAAASKQVRFAPIFVTQSSGRTREQYLLLVHKESTIERTADLRGRTLVFHDNPRVRLARPWLDTLLIPETGKSATEWLGKVTTCPKLSKTVLPVFFRQVDACVVTRSGFETMCELNPQVRKQLKTIMVSPEVVPVVFTFRADYAPAFKEDLFAGIRDLHKSVPGQQVLLVFQSDRIEEQPASCLDSALEILARHAELSAQPGKTNAASVTAFTGDQTGGNL